MIRCFGFVVKKHRRCCSGHKEEVSNTGKQRDKQPRPSLVKGSHTFNRRSVDPLPTSLVIVVQSKSYPFCSLSVVSHALTVPPTSPLSGSNPPHNHGQRAQGDACAEQAVPRSLHQVMPGHAPEQGKAPTTATPLKQPRDEGGRPCPSQALARHTRPFRCRLALRQCDDADFLPLRLVGHAPLSPGYHSGRV